MAGFPRRNPAGAARASRRIAGRGQFDSAPNLFVSLLMLFLLWITNPVSDVSPFLPRLVPARSAEACHRGTSHLRYLGHVVCVNDERKIILSSVGVKGWSAMRRVELLLLFFSCHPMPCRFSRHRVSSRDSAESNRTAATLVGEFTIWSPRHRTHLRPPQMQLRPLTSSNGHALRHPNGPCATRMENSGAKSGLA